MNKGLPPLVTPLLPAGPAVIVQWGTSQSNRFHSDFSMIKSFKQNLLLTVG
jgi:hypothetical protein